jgi:hypothetical protein
MCKRPKEKEAAMSLSERLALCPSFFSGKATPAMCEWPLAVREIESKRTVQKNPNFLIPQPLFLRFSNGKEARVHALASLDTRRECVLNTQNL